MKKIILGFTLAFAGGARADFAQDTADAQALRETTEARASYHYCIEGTLTCRTIVLLKDKITGEDVDDTYDVFLSSERAVGSTGYFLKNADGTFRALLDTVFDGKVAIDSKVPENQKLRVTFNREGLPTYHKVTIKRVGTTRWIDATMTYNAEESVIKGFEYDQADAYYRKPVEIIYKRVQN